MSRQAYPELLVWNAASGALFNTYTTAKTVLPGNCVYPFLANWWRKDRIIRTTVVGAISNLVTTPGTLTLQMMLGATVVMSSGALQLSSTAHTLAPFVATCIARCDVEGTSAQIMGQWVVQSQAVHATAVADGTETHTVLMGPNTAPALGSAFDSTAAQNLDFFAGFSISNAANGIQVQSYMVESLN